MGTKPASNPEPGRPSSGPALPAFGPRVLRVALGELKPGSEPCRPVELLGPAGQEAPNGAGGAPLPVPAPLSPEAARRIAGWGGTGLGLVLLAAAEEERSADEPAPLVLAVGDAVRRGVPTAARASILARAPLTGLLGIGQIGSDLGARLVGLADALVLQGHTDVPGAVLVVEGEGARLRSFPALSGLDPAARIQRLQAELGRGSTLTIGRGAEAGVRYASLAAGPMGTLDRNARPSLVGRGGLGAVLGSLGLAAVHVVAELPLPVLEAGPTGSKGSPRGDSNEHLGRAWLLDALKRSPRLRARAESGSLELFRAEDVRFENSEGRAAAAHTAAGSPLEAVERHGCRGCPTPCGWSFRRGDASTPDDVPAQPGRFSALRALGADLGLDQASASLELLTRCDELAVDAKEAGALLHLVMQGLERGRLVGASPRGDLRALLAWLDALVLGASGELPHALQDAAKRGAGAFARVLDLEQTDVHGAAARYVAGFDPRRPGRSTGGEVAGGLAALVGQCTSAGGADPMRTFPFLVEALDREELERVVGFELPVGADDPARPEGKGHLAWWHQNFVAGVDLTGFCAFSAAGLLADGVLTLDELAEQILTPGPLPSRGPSNTGDEAWSSLAPGDRLLAMGANIARLARALEARWGSSDDRDRPTWAAAILDHPELLPAHRALRGIGADGRPTEAALATLGTPAPGRPLGAIDANFRARASAPAAPPARALDARRAEPRAGLVELRAEGALARALLAASQASGAGNCLFELGASTSLGELLARTAVSHPELEPFLLAGDRPLPAVWRNGRRLRADARLEPGDVLELVVAIAGG